MKALWGEKVILGPGGGEKWFKASGGRKGFLGPGAIEKVF
jgi:hypothetical protein